MIYLCRYSLYEILGRQVTVVKIMVKDTIDRLPHLATQQVTMAQNGEAVYKTQMTIELLHGPHLKPVKTRGKPSGPSSWRHSTRFNTAMIDQIDRLAAQTGLSRGDIVRNAVLYFVNAMASATHADIDISASDDPSPISAPAPALADQWRGSGRQDVPNARRVNAANRQRKVDGKQGERLKDFNPSR